MPERMPAPPPGALSRLDGRIKLAILVAACFMCQYAPAAWLPVWLALLAAVLARREARSGNARAMLRGSAAFIIFWLVMTAGSDLLAGKGWREAVPGALPLGGRLLALTLVGVAFAGIASPLETGKATAWFMRPFLGRAVWKPALGIALTAWFLPLTLRAAGDVREGIRARGLVLPARKKLFLAAGAGLGILERTAGELAAGLASRRLDDWRSWH